MVDADMKWFVHEPLAQYKGEYVVISDKKVVLHGHDLKDMVTEFRKKYPGKTPLVAKIPQKDVLIL